MIIVKNKFIPFSGYSSITIWPFIFTKVDMEEIELNHENIHGRQQLECLIIPFYIIYLIEAILKGYSHICFEKEAYANQDNLNYLKTRKWYSMWR